MVAERTHKLIRIAMMIALLITSLACVQAVPTATPTHRPTNVPPATWTPTPAAIELPLPDIPALRELMLQRINIDRASENLPPVRMDPFAEWVAQAHALDMVTQGYMSHWNLAGEGPDIRYARAGGTEAVRENLHSFWLRYTNGDPAPIGDWEERIIEAQQGLMESPGHRETIMHPQNTHVGIGIAYNPATGDLRIAQEFIARYAEVALTQTSTASPEAYRIEGRLFNGAANPLINLAWEPFPTPKTIIQVEATHTYITDADPFDAFTPEMTNSQFSATFALPDGRQPGLYHVWLFADVGGERIPIADVLFEVN